MSTRQMNWDRAVEEDLVCTPGRPVPASKVHPLAVNSGDNTWYDCPCCGCRLYDPASGMQTNSIFSTHAVYWITEKL